MDNILQFVPCVTIEISSLTKYSHLWIHHPNAQREIDQRERERESVFDVSLLLQYASVMARLVHLLAPEGSVGRKPELKALTRWKILQGIPYNFWMKKRYKYSPL